MHIQLLCKPLVSFTNSADQMLVQMLIFLKHVLQEPMSIYSICTAPRPVDEDAYRANNHEYTQVEGILFTCCLF